MQREHMYSGAALDAQKKMKPVTEQVIPFLYAPQIPGVSTGLGKVESGATPDCNRSTMHIAKMRLRNGVPNFISDWRIM